MNTITSTATTRLDLIARLGSNLVGAEVGVLRGDFSAEILSLPNIATLYLIDPWEHIESGPYTKDPANVDQGGQDERQRFVAQRFKDDPRVKIMRVFSAEAWLNVPALDFAYLDAAHDYDSVLADLVFWSQTARVLFVHDFIENDDANRMGFGVVRAVNAFCQQAGWQVTAITEDEWPTVELRKG